MTIQIIGAGFGRTGTLSLKLALEELGFRPCYHMVELLQNPDDVVLWEEAGEGQAINWNSLLEEYEAIVDFPGCRHYRELMNYYPDAKVILTVRDPETWYESSRNTILEAGPKSFQKLITIILQTFSSRLRKVMRIVRLNRHYWQQIFEGRLEDKSYVMSVFNQHINEVKQTVPSERLLVYQVKEGWEPLCRFLGKPIPEGQPFPNLNKRSSFKQMSKLALGMSTSFQ
jgi:Sulfotransferase domain